MRNGMRLEFEFIFHGLLDLFPEWKCIGFHILFVIGVSAQ